MLQRFHPYNVQQHRNNGPGRNIYADMEYARNMGQHAYQYLTNTGDFSAPSMDRNKDESNQQMDINSNNDENNNNNASNAYSSMGSSSVSIGKRGKYTGNDATNIGYELYFHERVVAHSKKLRTYLQPWLLSRWFSNNKLGETPDVANIMTYSAFPGFWGWDMSRAYPTSGVTPFKAFGCNWFSLQDNVYSMPICFTVGDFLDNKVLKSATTGQLSPFKKIALKSITVEITPVTQGGHIGHHYPWMMAWIEANALSGGGSFSDQYFASNYYLGNLPNDQDINNVGYYFLRDINGQFIATDGFIDPQPDDSLSGSVAESNLSRKLRTIKNFDNNLTFIKSGETYSFTREVNSTGPYWLDPLVLTNSAQRYKPIDSLINDLEGQTTTTSSIIKKLPEYTNVLIAPSNIPITWIRLRFYSGNVKGAWVPFVNIVTLINIKLTAKWIGFDYNHVGTQDPTFREFSTTKTKIVDPLLYAENDFKSSTTNLFNIA